MMPLRPGQQKFNDVSEQHIASVFRVEGKAKQVTKDKLRGELYLISNFEE
jgi:hypothetical protein